MRSRSFRSLLRMTKRVGHDEEDDVDDEEDDVDDDEEDVDDDEEDDSAHVPVHVLERPVVVHAED